jgi:hypothetical protein
LGATNELIDREVVPTPRGPHGASSNAPDSFAEVFEPDEIYLIKVGTVFPDQSLMARCASQLGGFGLDLSDARLLLQRPAGPFDFQEYVSKVVEPRHARTVLLVEWKSGSITGGFAGVPWPTEPRLVWAVDTQRSSFVFSLESRAVRFELKDAQKALVRGKCDVRSGVGFGDADLDIYSDGTGGCFGPKSFGGPREARDAFPKGNHAPFVRFEIWML